MSDLVFILFLILFLIIAGLVIRYYQKSYYEMIEVWMECRSNIEKSVSDGSFDRILNVDDFNEWFNNNKDKEIYAHPGIFLRLDKLSQHHIQDFISVKSNGVINYEYFVEQKLIDFKEEIYKDWLEKKENL